MAHAISIAANDAAKSWVQALVGTVTMDFASTADAAVPATSATVTVKGAKAGDLALAALSTLTTDKVFCWATVTADDTVKVGFFNKSGAACDPGSGTVKVLVLKI